MSGPPAKTKPKKDKPKRSLADIRSKLGNNSKLRQQQSRDKLVQEVDVTKKYVLHTGARTRGSKIIIYAQSGMGKTTLATLAPNPVFLAADDGIDDIVNPVTGARMPTYKVESYQDIRNMLAQPDLFDTFDTIVVDTMTAVEEYGVAWILENVKTESGHFAKSLEHYGWGKGYYHLSEADNVIKHDLQKLVNMGKNVIVICQLAATKRSEAGADDYLKDTPKLVYRPGSKATAALDFVEWADHVFRIGYGDLKVNENKRVSSSGYRVIYVHPEVHFEAKSRTIPGRYPIVSFQEPSDSSIWDFVFDDAWKLLDEEEGKENGDNQ